MEPNIYIEPELNRRKELEAAIKENIEAIRRRTPGEIATQLQPVEDADEDGINYIWYNPEHNFTKILGNLGEENDTSGNITPWEAIIFDDKISMNLNFSNYNFLRFEIPENLPLKFFDTILSEHFNPNDNNLRMILAVLSTIKQALEPAE